MWKLTPLLFRKVFPPATKLFSPFTFGALSLFSSSLGLFQGGLIGQSMADGTTSESPKISSDVCAFLLFLPSLLPLYLLVAPDIWEKKWRSKKARGFSRAREAELASSLPPPVRAHRGGGEKGESVSWEPSRGEAANHLLEQPRWSKKMGGGEGEREKR
jgi:hypothetical protein